MLPGNLYKESDMTTSCFGGIHNFNSNRSSPNFVAGMEKITELKGAMNIVSKAAQTCRSLARQLNSEHNTNNRRYSTDPFFLALDYLSFHTYSVGRSKFKYCYRSLNEIQKLCKQNEKELKHFEKNFVNQYSKSPRVQTSMSASNISWEMHQLRQQGANFYDKAEPLACRVESSIGHAEIFHTRRTTKTSLNLSDAIGHFRNVVNSIS
jgi:hypothetical protein